MSGSSKKLLHDHTPVAQWMEQVFNDPFFRDPFSRLGQVDHWFGDFSPARFNPQVDVVDEENTLKVSAELPGMTKDDVELSIDNNTLTIRGEKRNEDESKENGVFRTERFYGYTQRAVPLPKGIDAGKAEASFDKGVLTVRFPKVAEKPSETTIPIS